MCYVIEFSVVIYNIKVTFIKHEFSWLFKFDANFSAYSFKEHICKESVTHERNNDLNKWKTTNVRIISHRTLHLGQSLKMCKYYCRKHILSHFLTKNMPTVAGVLWYPLHWIHQIHVWGFNTRIFKKLNWIVWRKKLKAIKIFPTSICLYQFFILAFIQCNKAFSKQERQTQANLWKTFINCVSCYNRVLQCVT